MNTLEAALKLAERGFHVFPLQPNGKLPIIEDYPNQATRDPEKIRGWWEEPLLGVIQPYNVGVSTTKFGDNAALVVVDVDNKGDKKGSDELLKLELEGCEFPSTLTAVTPTGGLHLIYQTTSPVKQGASVLAPGLDIRSRGGYIAGWGSYIDGVSYGWLSENMHTELCPQWIVTECGRAIEREQLTDDTLKIDTERANARAIEILNQAAPAIQGAGGDEHTFKLAAHLKDFGVDRSFALELMLTHWNPRCEPPWSPEELQKKIDNAYNYGTGTVGKRAPEHDFDKVEAIDAENYLEAINKDHALIFLEDSHMILFETVDQKGRPKRDFMKEATFKRKFSPFTVQRGRKGAAQTYADVWLDYKGRREYKGLCFSPEKDPGTGYYNLWRGFQYKEVPYETAGASAKMGFDLFMEHARQNVCGGEESLFQWLMGYLAHMVQKPFERPLTTLVFRGRKGVGKNALIDRIGKLLGSSHFLTAHNSRYLTSNFNGHLDSCLMLVLDEAFWSGDKGAESILKGLTTAPEIMIERKGKEPYMVDNLVRLVVIGNEDWLVPASYDERRYCVFDVGEGRKQQGEWFERMRILMDQKGGAEVLMDYLKKFDLKTVDVNKAPNTAALEEQKVESLSPFEQFWFACLVEGRIVNAVFANEWAQKVDKETFRQALAAYYKAHNIRAWVPNDTTVGRELKKLSPSTDLRQKMKINGNEWARCHTFGTLEQVRQEWNDRMGFEHKWE